VPSLLFSLFNLLKLRMRRREPKDDVVGSLIRGHASPLIILQPMRS
jgi:hypothetical protein